MKKGHYLIPFDQHGNQQHYPSSYAVPDPNGEYGRFLGNPHRREGPDWRDNESFPDVLEYLGHQRGRSAAYFEFRRFETKTKVTVFLTDFEAMIPHMDKGTVCGTFRFIKRGQNYGCVRIGEKP